jgi:Leucine-rich repeat (LRR) protein
MPARIDSIRSLQKINLARNRIRHINWLHKLLLLEELDLSSNRLSDIEAQLIVLVSNEVDFCSLVSPSDPVSLSRWAAYFLACLLVFVCVCDVCVTCV